MTNTAFDGLGLAEPLLRALRDADYHTPTPIQAKAIPPLLDGRDLLGLAETGSGKTAAFVLPILQRLTTERRSSHGAAARALILAPTRELAIQIGESIATYGRHMGLTHTVIYGGVGQRPQVLALNRGVDIIVATPGRLLDLCDQRHARLGSVGIVVLDEADRMLDMGFVRDVRRILKLVPVKRQSLLFSATMPDDIAKLAAEFLVDPVRVEIARVGKTVDRIDQRVIYVPTSAKRDTLARLLQDPELRRVMVFTRTKRGADRVCRAIESIGIGVHAIHGNKSQGQRQSALVSFRKGFTRVLVATDIAARGIDIDDVTHVINYELPNLPESYVHRIGRTARAGAEGIAIALCAHDERPYLSDIEKLIGLRLTVVGGFASSAVSTDSAEDDAANDDRPERSQRRPGGNQQRPAGRSPRAASGEGGNNRGRDGGRPGQRPEGRDGRPTHHENPRPRSGGPGRDEQRAPSRASTNTAPGANGERRQGPPSEHRRGEKSQGRGKPAGPRRDRDGGQAAQARQAGAPRGDDRAQQGRRGDTPEPWRKWTGPGEARRQR